VSVSLTITKPFTSQIKLFNSTSKSKLTLKNRPVWGAGDQEDEKHRHEFENFNFAVLHCSMFINGTQSFVNNFNNRNLSLPLKKISIDAFHFKAINLWLLLEQYFSFFIEKKIERKRTR